MAQSPPTLCDVCRRLDIQDVLLAAETAPFARNYTYSDGVPVAVRKITTHEAMYTTLRHQKSLTSLKTSAETCTSAWDTSITAAPHIVASQQTLDGRNSVTLACFEACAEYNTLPLSNDHLLARVQATSAADDQCFKLASDWLTECREKHAVCRETYQAVTRMPTRLLDVGLDENLSLQPDALIRLVQGQRCKGSYAALSYCWGPDRGFLLTHQSEAMLRQGFKISDMPGSLRDAVIVARRTKIPYVWIDALCIYQDQQEFQESRDDWARESGRMHEVYRNAIVTIEAASASRTNDGFLTSRQSLQPYCAVPWGPAQYVYLRPVSEISEHELYGATIYSRGWTMQERLLAPRTLSFGRSQMSFECANGFIDEAGRPSKASCAPAVHLSKDFMIQIRSDRNWLKKGIKSLCQTASATDLGRVRGISRGTELLAHSVSGQLTRPNGQSMSYHEYWAELVDRFSERQFTNIADRLPALSGLADEFRLTLNDTYVCGFWKSTLVSTLPWSCAKLYNRATWEDHALPGYESQDYRSPVAFAPAGAWPDTIKLPEYVAPSWSWASVIGIIHQPPGSMAGSTAKFIDVQITPQYATDPHGRVASGHLILSTRMAILPDPFVAYDSASSYNLQAVHAHIRKLYIDELNDHYATEAYQHHIPHANQQFALIELWRRPTMGRGEMQGGSVVMLLIESCAESKGKFQEPEWRRLCSVSITMENQTREEFLADRTEYDQNDPARRDYFSKIWESSDEISREILNAGWEKRRVKLI
ncbi:putative heterokaryon incompatibility [Septoria linicola]|nr:putative heterokaryon incompatibility [Septoria linicola]